MSMKPLYPTVVASLLAVVTANAQVTPPAGAPKPKFDPTGVGDTSVFAPLTWRPGNDIRTGGGAPGRRYWQQKVDYDIKASLDTAAKQLSGETTMRYANNSPDTLR